MAEEILFFEKAAIIEYIRTTHPNPRSKESEAITSLALVKLYEKLLGGTCKIGFPLNPSYSNQFPKESDRSIGEIMKILAEKKTFKEDSEIDVTIKKDKSNESVNYQLKRFGLGKNAGGGTKEFIELLIEYSVRPKTTTKLLVVMQEGTKIDPPVIIQWLAANPYPFSAVETVSMENDEVTFLQLFPKSGSEKFEYEKLLL